MKSFYFVAVLFLCSIALSAFADDQLPLTDENGLGFDEKQIGDFVRYDRKGRPIFLGGFDKRTEVYRGRKSVSGEFPTSGFIGNCTANAVALNVVVTAGHCKGTGARINFAHRESGKNYSATCTRHPRYNTRTIYNDYSLCKLDAPLPDGSKLLTFASARVPRGTDVWVNGYGAPNFGTHYWGNAKLTRESGQDLVSCNAATLGGGDSGGSLIVKSGERTLPKGGAAAGVNSRGNSNCSWYNDYAHSEFQSWAREYETKKDVKLCGISADCSGEPVDCEALHEYLGACITEAAPGCRKAYADLNSCIGD